MEEHANVSLTMGNAQRALARLFTDRRILGGLALFFLLITIGYFTLSVTKERADVLPYEEVYTLVPEKVSRSAGIVVRLPEGILLDAREANTSVSFEPKIKGEWLVASTTGILRYIPEKPLPVGAYYMVTLTTPQGALREDFLVDDDPRIDAIFPVLGTEASEYSEIVFVFNRPMVPLSTLSEVEGRQLPITITPQTEGTYHWTTTRTLQFRPTTRLARAAEYKIEVGGGFVSVEGLAVSATSTHFTTRPLRLTWNESGTTHAYDQPVTIRFNQPVDLAHARTALTVYKEGGIPVPVTVSHGRRVVHDEKDKEGRAYLDHSVIEFRGVADRFGRPALWDFNTAYTYTLSSAVPEEGTRGIPFPISGNFVTSPIITGLSAESPRSRHVAPDLFDPEGKLWVSFVEDVNIDKSKLTAKGLIGKTYGEKCREPGVGEELPRGANCPKIPDHRRIALTFDPTQLSLGETVPIRFEKIVGDNDFVLNTEMIERTVSVYPKLEIKSITPQEGASNASLVEMVICASTPLVVPDEKEFYEQVRSNVTVGLWNWHAPRRISSGERNQCAPGEFENTIRYGLVPKIAYTIDLSLSDEFGQSVSRGVHFTSADLAATDINITPMQKVYNVAPPERTKLVFATDNLDTLEVSVCKVQAPVMFQLLLDRPEATTPPIDLPCDEQVTKTLQFEPQYWSRRYVTIDLRDHFPDRLGHYIVSLGHPKYRKVIRDWDPKKSDYVTTAGERIFVRSFLTLTRLAVTEKKINWETGYYGYVDDADESETSGATKKALLGTTAPRNLYWVSRVGSLLPVVGAKVDLYINGGENDPQPIRTGSGVTDALGIARTKPVLDLLGAIVTDGVDSAIVAESLDRFSWGSSAQASRRTFLYSDRPIYRPGDTVHIKGITRVGYDGNYEISRERPLGFAVRDARWKEIAKLSLPVSEVGTFTADIPLDKNAALGTYSVWGESGYLSFDVEEYVSAAFKVDMKSDKTEYDAGEEAGIDINASYYFGVPVGQGEVSYAIVAQDYYFDRSKDPRFSFGAPWYSWRWDEGYGDRFIRGGTTALSDDGRAHVTVPLDFATYFKGDAATRSKIFTVRTTVKNSLGQSISAEHSFIVHRGAYYIGTALLPEFAEVKKPITLSIKTVDVKGEPVSQKDLMGEVVKVTWESYKRQEVDGAFYWRWESKKTPVRTFTLATTKSGDAETSFSLDEPGEYEVTVRGTDDRKNVIVAQDSFWVSGYGGASVRPTNNETLELKADTDSLRVGETASFIIPSPYPRAKALVTMERGRIFDYRILDISDSFTRFAFPVTETMIPNVNASVTLISPDPEVKYGAINYRVDTDKKTLTIDAKPKKPVYLPGEEVLLDVTVSDADGKPVVAELSLAVVDLSVLALVGNPHENPVAFFYGGEPVTVVTSSNVKNVLHEAEVPTGTKGGGGGALEKKKRGNFRDTALWAGVVTTDNNGHAQITFTLPDNLTTWQIETIGLTKDTRLGAGYADFMTQKRLMAVPLKPRFIIPGDEFTIGATIFNNTDEKIGVDVTFSTPTLIARGSTDTHVTIGARRSANVHFPVFAPPSVENGKHAFTLTAKSGDLEDTVEESILIKRNETYEAVATAGSSGDATLREYVYLPKNVIADRGGLTVTTASTLAGFMKGAIDYLAEYPYGCSEQVATRLSTLAIVKKGQGLGPLGEAFRDLHITWEGEEYRLDDVITIGVARLYANQDGGGGFKYYPEMEPSYSLTIAVVNALIDLKNAGYTIDDGRLRLAVDYLGREISSQPHYFFRSDTNMIMAAYTIDRAKGIVPRVVFDRVRVLADDNAYVNENGGTQSLIYLARYFANKEKHRSERIMKALENRVVIDGRGASLRSSASGEFAYDYYETPTRNTALFLSTSALLGRDTPLAERMERWLLAARAKDGAWGSTPNTGAVIEAMISLASWRREDHSNFTLDVALGAQPLGSMTFANASLASTSATFVPTQKIPIETLTALSFTKTAHNKEPNRYYFDALLKYFLPVSAIPPRDEGFSVKRSIYSRNDKDETTPLLRAMPGDVVKVKLTVTTAKDRSLVAIEDFIPAGFEIVNTRFATEDQSLENEVEGQGYEYDQRYGMTASPKSTFAKKVLATLGFFEADSEEEPATDGDLPDSYYGNRQQATRPLRPSSIEAHDDRLLLFVDHLPSGVYTYEYHARALIPGTFLHLPAVASEMYFPEHFGRTAGGTFTVSSAK